MTFLTEKTAPSVILEALTSASSVKLAVAFWGDAAVERMGLETGGLNAKVLCNLESGACNPNEIRKLLNLAPQLQVRTNPRLHAKLYWAETKAIIGSSNASSNGLAVEGRELSSWAEANLLVSDPELLAEMSEWFDDLFEASLTVSEVHLAQAELIWEKRRMGRAPGISGTAGVIETCRRTTDHPIWNSIWVCYALDRPSKEAEAIFAATQAEHQLAAGVSYYEGWQESLRENDWVFDFPINSKKRSLAQGIWRILPYFSSAESISFAVETESFMPDGFGKIEFSDTDRKLLASAAQHFREKGEDGRNALVLLKDVVSHLETFVAEPQPDRNQAKQLSTAFNEAMRNIYFEAQKVGYKPTGFWQMLQTKGAEKTAIDLTMQRQPSEGFTRLFLMNRPDLTVEHLVLQEPWRELFGPEVIAAAERRLKR